MLPSSGYFRSILCPYFESGLCDRVYCHFRHKKKVTVSYIPTPTNQLKKAFAPAQSSSSSSSASTASQYRPVPLDQIKLPKQEPIESEVIKGKNGLISKPEATTSQNLTGDKTKDVQKKGDKSKESSLKDQNHQSSNDDDGLEDHEEDDDDDDNESAKSSVEDSDVCSYSSEEEKTLTTKKSSLHLKDSTSSPGKDKKSETKSLLDDIEKLTKKTQKQRKNLDREIERSVRKKKKFSSLLISEQEQKLSELSKRVRVAHKAPDNANQIMSEMLAKKSMKLTPAQIMFNRFLTAQSNAEDNSTVSSDSAHIPTSDLATASKKKRVAHTIKPTNDSTNGHNKVNLKKPTVFPEIGSKVPTNLRQKYLDVFVNECLKVYKDRQKAYDRAMTEEKSVYRRSPSKNIYLNLAVNAVKKIRNESKTSN